METNIEENQKITDISKTKIIEILKQNPEILNNILENARKDLDKKGINYKLYEQTNNLVTKPDYCIKLLENKLNKD
jgi:hypothetical protein